MRAIEERMRRGLDENAVALKLEKCLRIHAGHRPSAGRERMEHDSEYALEKPKQESLSSGRGCYTIA